MKINKICCIGAGYVGGPSMSVIAQKCPEIIVTVVDNDINKIKLWNSEDLRNLPIHEDGLSKIIKETRGRNLFFSNDTEKAIYESEMIFLAVNTPTKSKGKGKGEDLDLTNIRNCAILISKISKHDKIIIEKSTLPVRTAEELKKIFQINRSKINFEVLSNPEFLAEGTAIKNLYKSDRVLIGGDKTKSGKSAVKSLKKIYSNWIPTEKIIVLNIWSAELAKLVSNAFLAQRISSINSISELCENTGADVLEIANSVGKDHRIGEHFLNPSPGFGGSCFKKDILCLVYIAKQLGLDNVAKYWNQVIEINDHQRFRIANMIINSFNENYNNKKVGILGWAFKKGTNDSRESSSIYITERLLKTDLKISVYDPLVNEKKIFKDLCSLKKINRNKLKSNLIFNKDPYLVMADCDVLVILTEWEEFRSFNWNKVFDNMKKPAKIFDFRNILRDLDLKKIGFEIKFLGL